MKLSSDKPFGQRVRIFFSPARAVKKQTAFLLVYTIVISFLSVYNVKFLEFMTSAIENKNQEEFVMRMGLLAIALLLNYFLKVWYKPRIFSFFRESYKYVEGVYLKKYLQMDNNDAERIGTGRLMSIVQKGIYVWLELLGGRFWYKMISVIMILLGLFFIGQKSWVFVGVALLLILCGTIRISMFAGKSLERRKKTKDLSVEMDRTVVRWFMSKHEIQQQDGYRSEVEKRNADHDELYVLKFNEKTRQARGFDTVVFVAEVVFMVGITGFVGRGVIQGSYSFADFVLISGMALVIKRHVFILQMEARKTIDELVHFNKLISLFDSTKKMKGYDSGETFQYKKGIIQLKNIHYAYDGDNNILEDFFLEIDAAKKTALVGPSGGGKSTLIKLIAGYLRPDSGSVIVDGQDLQSVSLKSYYGQIGYLTQEPGIFDGTVYENLTYAVRGSVDEKILHKTIKASKCEFVYDLVDGLDTEIGERGIRLSGGQRQRLAIAKIMLKDPKIVLLDEPTSALDSFAEEAVTEAMNNLFETRTVIIIAHRLQTVKHADDIIVIDQGKIIERGTHKELVKQKGHYAKMLELQSGF